jgi:hypothetical protein
MRAAVRSAVVRLVAASLPAVGLSDFGYVVAHPEQDELTCATPLTPKGG